MFLLRNFSIAGKLLARASIYLLVLLNRRSSLFVFANIITDSCLGIILRNIIGLRSRIVHRRLINSADSNLAFEVILLRTDNPSISIPRNSRSLSKVLSIFSILNINEFIVLLMKTIQLTSKLSILLISNS